MSLSPGNYSIISALGDNVFLTPGSGLPIFNQVLGEDSPRRKVHWTVTPIGLEGSNLYNITQAGVEGLHLVTFNDALWITFRENVTDSVTAFSIESAGNAQWRVHIPNQDSVWTLDNVGDQVKTLPDEGLRGQRWIFNSELD